MVPNKYYTIKCKYCEELKKYEVFVSVSFLELLKFNSTEMKSGEARYGGSHL
jgi:hypothetical protein